ncbi:MAG: hypothetical protein P4M09_20425 [Devosia sp.]|nr:hypothetical protein [Devosia sp.]
MTRDYLSPPARVGLWLLGAATLLGLIDAMFNYFWTGNGIHGTQGALIVAGSTLLQLVAFGLIAGGVLRGGLKVLFEVLIFLDLLGTGLAAYMLEAWMLLALTVVALIGFLLHLGTAARRTSRREVTP